MQLFANILCPISFDENSLAALELARDLATANGASLYLLHVARIPIADMDSPVPIPKNPWWEQQARARLERLAHDTLAEKIPYKVQVVSGIAETEVLDTARALRVDLIVMATHGRTGLKHLILGSVAEAVLREAPCPVLMLREHSGQRPDAA